MVCGHGGLVLLMSCTTSPPEEMDGQDDGTGGIETPSSTSASSTDDSDASPSTSDDEPADTNPDNNPIECGEVEVAIAPPPPPTVALLIDQSGTMVYDFNGIRRWDAVYETLMDPNTGLVARLESSIRFGLTLYTSFLEGRDPDICPQLTTVDAGLLNYNTILDTYETETAYDNDGDTPTGESLMATADALAALPVEGPKIIILATDGEPDSCLYPNLSGTSEERAMQREYNTNTALDGARHAYDLGIETYIISVGTQVAEEHLQDMANLGVGLELDPPTDAPYYQALNPDDLVDAFDEIAVDLVSCEFAIDGEVDVSSACEGTVQLDGETLKCETDWTVPNPSTLLLQGAACDAIRSGGAHEVDASWPCDVVIVG